LVNGSSILSLAGLYDNSKTYSINFISDGVVSCDFGIIYENSIIGIPLGQNVTVISTDGACTTEAIAVGPTVCSDDCTFPILTVGTPLCEGIGSGTYSVSFTLDPSDDIITSNFGTINNNTIEGIPLGENVTITAGSGDCEVSIIAISPIDCDDPCQGILLSVVATICSNDQLIYKVALGAMLGSTITSDLGIVNGYSIIDIPIGSSVEIEATNPNCTLPHKVVVESPNCKDDEKEDFYIPNAFSPNGDSKDDIFVIKGVEGVMSISIYNNWGNLVYKSNDYKNDWNGTCSQCAIKGEGLPTSTYYYILDITNNKTSKRYTGFIYLSR